jgi:hypothetical protein
MTNSRKWKYATFAALGVLALIIATPTANAATDNTQLVQQILNIVKSPVFGNQAIMNAIGNGASQTSVNSLQTTSNDIKDTQYVPFSAISSNSEPFVCVPEETFNDRDHIIITSSADLMVNSVIIEPDNVIRPDDFLAVPFVTIQGDQIFISSGDLAPTGSTATNVAFDIMTSKDGYPHQVVGSNINFELSCQHDSENDDDAINFEKIIVSGWKKAGSTVTITYQE